MKNKHKRHKHIDIYKHAVLSQYLLSVFYIRDTAVTEYHITLDSDPGVDILCNIGNPCLIPVEL